MDLRAAHRLRQSTRTFTSACRASGWTNASPPISMTKPRPRTPWWTSTRAGHSRSPRIEELEFQFNVTNVLDEEYYGTISSGIGRRLCLASAVTGAIANCVNARRGTRLSWRCRLLLDRCAAHLRAVGQVQLLMRARDMRSVLTFLLAGGGRSARRRGRTGRPADPHRHFQLQSQSRRAGRVAARPRPRRTMRRPEPWPRSSSGCGPISCCLQEFDYDAGRQVAGRIPG